MVGEVVFLASVAKFYFAQQAARSYFRFALAAPISVDSGPTLPRQIQLYPTLPGPVESLTPSLDWSNLLYQLGPVEDHARFLFLPPPLPDFYPLLHPHLPMDVHDAPP